MTEYQEKVKQKQAQTRKDELEKTRLKKAAARNTNKEVNTVIMPDGKRVDSTKKEQRNSYERKGFVRVFKNMIPENIQDALDKGFRAVMDKNTNKQVERSGGQSVGDGSLLRQLWMEIPENKWKELKQAESNLRINRNKQHIKKHIQNTEGMQYDDNDEFTRMNFSSPNLGAGIDLSDLKEEHLQQSK